MNHSSPDHPVKEINDRRPLRSRGLPIYQWLAEQLADKGIAPNTISVASAAAGITAGSLLAATNLTESHTLTRVAWVLAAGAIQFRLICNMLDGMVAVQANRFSPTGDLYNEIPDRISDSVTLIGLGIAAGAPAWLGCLAACIAVMVAYVRAQGKASGTPYFFTGPMAKPQRMAAATITCVLMAVLPARFTTSFWGPAEAWGLPAACLWLIIIGGVWTMWRRLIHISRHLHASANQSAP